MKSFKVRALFNNPNGNYIFEGFFPIVAENIEEASIIAETRQNVVKILEISEYGG